MGRTLQSLRSRLWPATPVKLARLQAGASAAEVALTAGVTATRFSFIERGLKEPTPQEVAAVNAAIERLASREPRP